MGALALTNDKARAANWPHDRRMPELIARASQAILEAQQLLKEQRSLRFQAAILASELGAAIVRSQAADKERSLPRMNSDQSR